MSRHLQSSLSQCGVQSRSLLDAAARPYWVRSPIILCTTSLFDPARCALRSYLPPPRRRCPPAAPPARDERGAYLPAVEVDVREPHPHAGGGRGLVRMHPGGRRPAAGGGEVAGNDLSCELVDAGGAASAPATDFVCQPRGGGAAACAVRALARSILVLPLERMRCAHGWMDPMMCFYGWCVGTLLYA